MKRSWMKMFGFMFLAALLCSPAWSSIPPQPGVINYVEGQAAIGGQALNASSAGSAQLAPGQVLTTQAGKAEILLTPGAFLRLADHASLQMVSPALEQTVLTLQKGRALVEADQVYAANDIRINEGGSTVRLLKPGLYDFDADRGQIRVFNGEVEAQVGPQNIKVKKDHQLSLNASGKLKAEKFDSKAYEDGFYQWSSLRSSYLAGANMDAARRYADSVGGSYNSPAWYGAGWYWDPGFAAYTFLPADGMFYSPFGWGYYSPWVVVGAPYFGYGYGHYGHFGRGYHAPFAAHGFVGHAYGGGAVGSFHGGGFRGGFARGGGGRR